MQVDLNLRKVAITIGSCAAILSVGYWFFAANISHGQARDNAKQLKILTDIHNRQDTVEEAERKQLENLCREAKLEVKDCPVGVHPDDDR